MDITYRQATVADVEMLVENRVAFLNEISGEQGDTITESLRTSLRNYFVAAIDVGSYICWIAEASGEVAGIGAMVIRQQPANYRCPNGMIAYIMNMYTQAPFRKKGIGGAILERLTNTCRELNINMMELHATPDGEPVYRAHGFAEPKSIVLEKQL